MKVLVTGGAGYIGSHVVAELCDKGYEPVIIDNLSNSHRFIIDNLKTLTGKDIPFYEVDCCDFDSVCEVFKKEKIEQVIHFVASKSVGESVKKPLDYYFNNINSLISVIRAMSLFGVGNLVFSSSCSVYGSPEEIPVTEDSLIKKAFSPYGNTKQICEEIIIDSLNAGNLKNAVLLRYFNPIGAHSSGMIGELPIGEPQGLVPRLTLNAKNLLPEIEVFGDDYDTYDGTCVRDYIHVVDLAKAHLSAFEYLKDKNLSLEIFNIGIGKGVSVLEMIELFEKTTGQKIKYKIGKRREGDVVEVYADTSKVSEVLGWKPTLSIEEALESAWKWELSRFSFNSI